uniref:Ubiquitin associated and SH3 domain containing Bb n=1 Tax=Callorhinchus milii TaxID=7868 RepID=A0A4W3HKA0_CALMI
TNSRGLSDWIFFEEGLLPPGKLFSHVDDPFLDDTLPREYVLYLRPTGPLANKLLEFWHQSRQLCGKNKAHNIFPHITLCQFFMCEDSKVDGLSEALQHTVSRWRATFPFPLALELYTSSNFIGLFVEEDSAEIIKKFAADFASEATSKAGEEPPTPKHLNTSPSRSLALTLTFQLVLSFGLSLLCCLSTLRVMYPYTPQNDDELELAQGDFIFMSPVEQSTTSEGWIYGTSLGNGCSGLLPENYIARADECDTWVYHCSCSFLSAGAGVGPSLCDGGLRRRGQEEQGPGEALSLPIDLICQPVQVPHCNSQLSRQKRCLFVCRHGERMDVVFGKHWISQCFDAKGNYIRSNLNMPLTLPQRCGGFRDYEKDAPITVFGCTQARLVGEALLESKSTVDHVYCSPSLRCVQTAFNILKGLQQETKVRIRVEPGLFEWTKWVSGNSLPAWMTPCELAAANLGTDTTYRPHIQMNKLGVSEAYETYISRSFQVMRDILGECKAKGNNILIVAHASSLEACTRQLQGLSPSNAKDFVQVVRKIPYLGFCACEEVEDAGIWQLVTPPILPLTHGPNHSFSWREILYQE